MGNQAKFNLFDNTQLSAGANVTSEKIPLAYASGFFAVNGTLNGIDPDITIEYLVGDGTQFVTGDSAIVTGLDSAVFNIQFSPDLGEYIKIKLSNNSQNTAVISLNLIFTEKLS